MATIRATLQDLLVGFCQRLEHHYLLRDIRVRVLQTLYDFMEQMPWEQAWDPALVSRAPGYVTNAAALAAEWRGSPDDLPHPSHGNAFCMPATKAGPAVGKPASPTNFPYPLNLFAAGAARLAKRVARFDEGVVACWQLHSAILPPVIADVLACIAPVEDHLHDWAARYRDLVVTCDRARDTRMRKWLAPVRLHAEVVGVGVQDVLGSLPHPHILLDPSAPLPGVPRWTGSPGGGPDPGSSDGGCLDDALGPQLGVLEARLGDWQASVGPLVPEVLREFGCARPRLSLAKSHVSDFHLHHTAVATTASASAAVVQAYKDQATREEAAIQKSPQLVLDLPGVPTIFMEFVGPDSPLGACIVREMARPFR